MKRSEIILMFIQVPLDFLLLLAAGMSAYYLRFSEMVVTWRPVLFSIPVVNFFHVLAIVSVGWIIIFALTGLYRPDPNRKLLPDLTSVVLACSAGLAAVAVFLLFQQTVFDSRFLVIVSWILAILFVSLGRVFMRGVKGVLYRQGIGLRRVVIVGSGESAVALKEILKQRPELGYKVLAEFETVSAFLTKPPAHLDELLFLPLQPKPSDALQLLDFCNAEHVVLKYSADLFATYAATKRVQPLAGVPMVELARTPLDGWGRVLKRFCDIVLSSVAIIVFSPIMMLIAVAIMIETGRPILYKNERVGIRGQKFFTLKFRSMFQKDSTGPQFGKDGLAAEKREQELIKTQNTKAGPIYKISNDPRVTKLGKFLRRWSLDELPQFFNVLGGSMSLVGPRPHQPREVDLYAAEHKRVLIIKPGITGLAQISGRSDLSFGDEIRLDAFYIEHWGILLDLIIILKTPFILFKKRKAL
ncbi:MAG: sugar transferase [Candidatus Magasanikbacteria bacterium]|nr:sugar transferase [Candidatus Magasanikbacteria bacterium]